MTQIGLLLLVAGAALAVVEAHVPTHGALGAVGVAAGAGGLALLVAGAGSGTGIAVAVALVAALVGVGYLWIVLRKALAARRTRVRSGVEGLIGRVGEVRSSPAPLGQVFLDGALWRARLWSFEEDRGTVLEQGDPIVVERVDGLTLTVRRAEDWELF
jgi:membrane-bound ClpP family serine protease